MQIDSPPNAFKESLRQVHQFSERQTQRMANYLWFQIYPDSLKSLISRARDVSVYEEFFDVSFCRQRSQLSTLTLFRSIQEQMIKSGKRCLEDHVNKHLKKYSQQITEFQIQNRLDFDQDTIYDFVNWYWSSLDSPEIQDYIEHFYLKKNKFICDSNSFFKKLSEFSNKYFDKESHHLDEDISEYKKSNSLSKQAEMMMEEDVVEEMIVEDGDQISPPIYSQRYEPTSKRSNKEGFVRLYRCNHCSKEFKVNRSRCLQHKRQCRTRTSYKQNLIQIQQNEVFPSVGSNNDKVLIEQNPQFSALEKQVIRLKATMNMILQSPGKTYFEQEAEAQQLAKKIWDETKVAIGNLMENRLKEQIIKEKLNNKTSYEVILKTMRASLISRLYELDVKELMICWSYKLSDSCDQLISLNKSNNCRPETVSRDNTAAKFILQFNQYQLTSNQKRFLEHLGLLTRYKRTNVVRFYHKLLRRFPQLDLKVLPINLNVYKFTFQRSILRIQDITKIVEQLWKREQKTLATDVWVITCLGLRKSELLRLIFRDEKGKFIKYLKIYEQKNQNTTARFIPLSVLQIIQLSGTSYPISQERFSKTRDYCLSSLGQFYGLRHVCLTNIVVSLLGQSKLSIHKSSQMTLSRYVNLENWNIINKTFSLPLIQEHLQPSSIVFSSFFPFFQKDGKIVMNRLDEETQFELREQTDDDYVEDRSKDSILSHQIDKDFIKSEEIENDQKIAIFEQQQIYQNHLQELLEREYSDYVGVINSVLQQSQISSFDIKALQIERCQPITVASRLEIISQILNLNIFLYRFQDVDNAIISEVNTFQTQGSPTELIISQTPSTIKISEKLTLLAGKRRKTQSEDQIQSLSSRKYQLRPRGQKNISYHMTSGTSICSKCFRFLELVMQRSRLRLKCFHCNSNYDEVPSIQDQQLVYRQTIVIKPVLETFSSKINLSIKASKARNNLKISVEREFGEGSYCTEAFYSSEVPKFFSIEMNFHANLTQEAIYYNKQYEEMLPLEIKQSNIPHAGQGLFATSEIKDGQLIITYSGVIRTHLSLRSNSDSLFILGCMTSAKDSEGPLEIMIEPRMKLNGARFANCGKKPFSSNASSILGLCRHPEKNFVEIIVYLYSTSFIAPGSQILYDYGDSYSFITRKQ